MARKAPVIDNIPDYEGAAVYALVDETGRKYVGSTTNLKRRLSQHSTGIRGVLKNGHHDLIGCCLEKAVKDGHRFRAEILKSFPSDVSHIELLLAERAFLIEADGQGEAYNSCAVYFPLDYHDIPTGNRRRKNDTL